IEVPQPGAHTISYRATDVAGNVAGAREQGFRVVDLDAPPLPTPPTPSPHRATPNPTPTATLSPLPPFAVIGVIVDISAGTCPYNPGTQVYACTFSVSVMVVNAKGQEAIQGTLTASSTTSHEKKIATFQILIQSAGARGGSTSVIVSFSPNCPAG